MPTKRKTAVGKKISKLRKKGKSQRAAVATALSMKRADRTKGRLQKEEEEVASDGAGKPAAAASGQLPRRPESARPRSAVG